MTTVTVRIDNDYSDGHHSQREVEVPAPPALNFLDLDGTVEILQEWFEEEVWNYTGDGHGAGPDAPDSCYTATIIAADDERLVGIKKEWV